jgi:hypothetical protein
MTQNPYHPPLIVSGPAKQRRSINWLLVAIVCWFGMGLAAILWGWLWMVLGLPIGN